MPQHLIHMEATQQVPLPPVKAGGQKAGPLRSGGFSPFERPGEFIELQELESRRQLVKRHTFPPRGDRLHEQAEIRAAPPPSAPTPLVSNGWNAKNAVG
ncbi:hypothetical protein GCM10018780_53760 [Streptomyces lanatus]|nr:hypothetical protein GCM10018780_53760 [Streptomyces lanatus]